MFLQKFFNKQFIQTAFAIAASVLAVAGFVYAATTIGTNISIDGNLTVSGTSATSTFSTGGLTVGANQFVVQQTSGNVGIGTTSPTAPLTINGNIDIYGGATAVGSIFVSCGAGGLCFNNPNVSTFGASGNGWFAMRFNNGSNKLFFGNTGSQAYIGTATAYPLRLYSTSINGDPGSSAPATYFEVQLSSFNFTGGSVGIGTTSPSQLLSVAGDAYIAGIGTTTLNLKTTTASKGTCIEMFDSGGAVNRLYVNPDHMLKIEAGTCK